MLGTRVCTSGMTVCMTSRGLGGGGSQINITMTLFWKELNLAKIGTKDLLKTSQTLLPLSHLNWIVCRCPLRRAVHQLSLCFCLQFTFTGSYTTFKTTCVMWWGHTVVQIKEDLVTISAIKCTLSCHTHNLQGSLKSKQKWPLVARNLLCILGVNLCPHPSI